jgi:hypothetical protein
MIEELELLYLSVQGFGQERDGVDAIGDHKVIDELHFRLEPTSWCPEKVTDSTRCSGVLFRYTGFYACFFLTFFDQRFESRYSARNTTGYCVIEITGPPDIM